MKVSMEQVKNKSSWIIAGILLLLLFVTLFFNYTSSLSNEYMVKRIDQIESEIKKLREENEQYQKKIDGFQNQISKIDDRIDENNQKIDKIRKDGKDKITRFKHYDARMWERYFTERYKQKK
jgi:peptidoglycan hydrolase CwlO-like protein